MLIEYETFFVLVNSEQQIASRLIFLKERMRRGYWHKSGYILKRRRDFALIFSPLVIQNHNGAWKKTTLLAKVWFSPSATSHYLGGMMNADGAYLTWSTPSMLYTCVKRVKSFTHGYYHNKKNKRFLLLLPFKHLNGGAKLQTLKTRNSINKVLSQS